MEEKKFFTIGEAVKRLNDEFPELTISKIRFLEDRGLVKPYRTSGGYRKFSINDIKKIKLLLHLQKDQYLPLEVIKEKLRDYNPENQSVENFLAKDIQPQEIDQAETPDTLLLCDAPEALGVPLEDIEELEAFGIIRPYETGNGEALNATDIQLISISRELSRFGIQPRHLRMYQNFAEREASFYEQILLPSLRQKNPDGRRKAEQSLSELLHFSKQFKHLLLKNSLEDYLAKQ